ncbi:ATP-NAD kinase [Haloarcula litorea]|uniref:ATP-NAD kinase n=1 Tax=Haloarcula litorea TaxID=3032579 RepID=UPI0023E78428|nr:ATP-NAD kinase [Halomicroarcula sp. GDY20]
MSERIGVVGDDAVAERLRKAGLSVAHGTGDAVPATDRVVAVGQTALSRIAAAEDDPLVLPVAAGRGVRSVPDDAVASAVADLDDARVERHPVLSVAVDGSTAGTAVWDVTLVTDDAARISEYAVETPTDPVARLRADGVTVATPAGSPGYARRVGAPVLAPLSDACVVAPIAPFATNPDHWVVPADDLSVTVLRDEAPVDCYLDGEAATAVPCGGAVTFGRAGTLRVAVVGASESRFG